MPKKNIKLKLALSLLIGAIAWGQTNWSAKAQTPIASQAAEIVTTPLKIEETGVAFLAPLTLTVSPSRIGDDYSLHLGRGDRETVWVQVTNPSNQTIQIETLVQDFIVGGSEGTTPILLNDQVTPSQWAMEDWVNVGGSTKRTLEPQEQVNIPVTIVVPKTAAWGGHYAAVVQRISNQNELDGTGSKIMPQVATMLYVVVGEGEQLEQNLEITDFRFDALRETGPMHYQFTLKNDSNYHTHPEGELVIKNFFGKVLETLPINYDQNIFPSASRTYQGIWEKSWGFGPYTAELTFVYGPEENVASAQTRFWILPMRLMILIGLVVVVIITIFINNHEKHKKELAEAEKEKEDKNSNQEKKKL